MNKQEEFKVLVKAVHDAVDEYAEDRLSGRNEWFVRGLEAQAQTALHRLLAFGVTDSLGNDWEAESGKQ